MKTIEEILEMLVHELINHLYKIKSINSMSTYHNEVLGDTSVLLAGLLGLLLKKNYNEWDREKWMDDSLITKINMQNNKLKIEGIMIWGKVNTTEQWTDPFSFEIELLKDKGCFKEFNFLFCDLERPEITYEDFRDDRDHWAGKNRKWRYIINSNEALK